MKVIMIIQKKEKKMCCTKKMFAEFPSCFLFDSSHLTSTTTANQPMMKLFSTVLFLLLSLTAAQPAADPDPVIVTG